VAYYSLVLGLTVKVIHLIPDNYRIHRSRITQMVVASAGGNIVLRFLPPCCPNESKIDRLWQALYANVTRSRPCASMDELVQKVRWFLRRRAKNAIQRHQRHAA
jgi:transposase